MSARVVFEISLYQLRLRCRQPLRMPAALHLNDERDNIGGLKAVTCYCVHTNVGSFVITLPSTTTNDHLAVNHHAALF
jgi:hypothetical protein